MDAIGTPGGGPNNATLGGTNFSGGTPVGYDSPTAGRSYGGTTIIATSNDATATIVIAGSANYSTQTCIFLWQAVEAPN